MDLRKLVYKKPAHTTDADKFVESKNYKSPEYLLKTEDIYFKHNDKKLKSLVNFFCGTRNSIEYKNRFANSYVKNFLYGIKKPVWQAFFNKSQQEQINELNLLITQFNNSVNNTPSTYINITSDAEKYTVELGKVVQPEKTYTEFINFLFTEPLQMLTLFVLLENDNEHIAPLKILKYELEIRVIIENVYNTNFDAVKNIITELFEIPADFDLTTITKDNSGEYCGGLSMFEKYGGNITFFNGRLEDLFRFSRSFAGSKLDYFFKSILDSYFKNGSEVPRANREFIDGLNAGLNVTYNYSNTSDYYLTFSDIDSSMNNLRLADLIYFSYFFNTKNVGTNIKEKIMGSMLYGFCHEIGHEVDSCFNGLHGYRRLGVLNGIVPGNTDIDNINSWITGNEVEAVADIFSYKMVALLLEQISSSENIKKDVVRYMLFMTCGDRTTFGHADTMMRVNYIRYFPEFDKYLPQDNSYYVKYLKYKNKYLALKNQIK